MRKSYDNYTSVTSENLITLLLIGIEKLYYFNLIDKTAAKPRENSVIANTIVRRGFALCHEVQLFQYRRAI
jgi:hypothetical protein